MLKSQCAHDFNHQLDTLQRMSVASVEILFAKNCRTYEIWGRKVTIDFLGGACLQTPLETTAVCRPWLHYLELACCGPAG